MAAEFSANLVLVRHAKAADGSEDIERPLTGRGRRDSAALGRWLKDHDIRPDRAVVSTALRAQQTWSAAASELDGSGETVLEDRIYDNDVDALFEITRETPDSVGTLVLVGHNPSFEQFAHHLDDGDGDADASRGLNEGYPTCAVAVFRTERPWGELSRATLVAFAAPRG